jgi:hypothetical protein
LNRSVRRKDDEYHILPYPSLERREKIKKYLSLFSKTETGRDYAVAPETGCPPNSPWKEEQRPLRRAPPFLKGRLGGIT